MNGYDHGNKPRNRYVALAKTELGNVWHLERALDATLDEIERLHSLRTRITSVLRECTTGAPGFSGDSRADATAKLIEIENRLTAEVQQYSAAVDRTLALINGLRSARQREVMHRRYVLGWKFQRIAGDLQLELDSVYHIHGRALYYIGRALDAGDAA